MIIFIVGIVVLAIIIGVAAFQSNYGYGDVKITFSRPDSGSVLHTGRGNSIGSAILDGFFKLYEDITPSSRLDTIEMRYSTMVETLNQYRSRMHSYEIARCEEYISRTKELLEDRRKEDAAMSDQRRFVREQRRLMSDSLRYDVMHRDGFRCQICGATAADGLKLHVDHIIPVSKGGKTELSNLRTLCERCNMGKGAKLE